jgi:hypothetical protein
VYVINDAGFSVEVLVDHEGVYVLAECADVDAVLWAISRCSELRGER